MVGAPFTSLFQAVPLDCFPEQSENLYTKAEYILPAQLHKLYSHSPLQSNSVWVENMSLHIYFAFSLRMYAGTLFTGNQGLITGYM